MQEVYVHCANTIMRKSFSGRKAKPKVSKEVEEYNQLIAATSIICQSRVSEGQAYYQWRNSLDEAFSPEFTDLQVAINYPKDVGLKIIGA